MYVPKAGETFTYDLDGNLTGDSRWTYIWDAENRLVTMVAKIANGPQRLEFEYDAIGRRIAKTVRSTTSGTSSIVALTRFLYDGWNLIAELDGNNSNAVIRTYQWGKGMGAGGNGGLISIKPTSNNANFTCYDGDDNLVGLTDGGTGLFSAKYEYGPFAESVRISGLNSVTPIRFSCKYQDDETDLIYYGYRYFCTAIGRWIAQDPIGEAGALNVYSFANNSPTVNRDVYGLLVTGILDEVAQILTVVDDDTHEMISLTTISGGHVGDNGIIVTPGAPMVPQEVPIPSGKYFITSNIAWRIDSHNKEWFSVLMDDDRLDDYFYENGKQRGGIRLHLGRRSHGCVTVCNCKDTSADGWKRLREMLLSTKTGTVNYFDGPHWYNTTKSITEYGVLYVRGFDEGWY